MELIIILAIIVVSVVVAFVFNHRIHKREKEELSAVFNAEEPTSDESQSEFRPLSQRPGALVNALKLFSALTLILGVFAAISVGMEFGAVAGWVIFFSSVMGCVFWQALAVITRAAKKYLDED